MTDPVETIVCEPVPSSEVAAAIVKSFTRIGYGGTEFLDQAWAEEFDRRLAAWESEAPASPHKEVGRGADVE